MVLYSSNPLPSINTNTNSTSLLQPLKLNSPSTPTTLFFHNRRRPRYWIHYALFLLLLIVLGTIVVLSTANAYFGITHIDLLTPTDLALLPKNTTHQPPKIPKIIHQTWKTNMIPDKWKSVRDSCSNLHSDWEYVLWSDESGRELIQNHYPGFLKTFDGYRYPIQRADAIRYFVLHKYGGVYMDLDIGCRKPMDILLSFDLILPQTIPVGVSNDLMFSVKGHPFMDYVINRLSHFDHDYLSNYPTVMFSTGPMALSALLSSYRSTLSKDQIDFRILSPELYGKNLPPNPTQLNFPFFSHYYGSCWHTPDANFIVYLGKSGMIWLYGAISILLLWLTRASLRFWVSSLDKKSTSKRLINRRLLLLPVNWLDQERKSSRRAVNVNGRCKCCGSLSNPSSPPAYESPLSRPESDNEDDLYLFPTPSTSSTPSSASPSTRRKEVSSPIHKAFFRLADLVHPNHQHHHHPIEQNDDCLLEAGAAKAD
ncbi:hypothetical protein CROQUDRAFT_44231 [Cronartium quercuum f. sp. fusiforme G11]|uniref:Uncharacterized protein n=1 Tax=Cronartium quercuum f. sp. fusiforme G11 TaxID=708437 RepID=A0A9P6NLX9_9BASI|nr:hypothetical protein CROQUDRAFT_44231 [Cronartium quercuum f. sp. fusiforme G11]